MDEVFVSICVGNEEKAIWRVSKSQWEVIQALKDIGAFSKDADIVERNITFMN